MYITCTTEHFKLSYMSESFIFEYTSNIQQSLYSRVSYILLSFKLHVADLNSIHTIAFGYKLATDSKLHCWCKKIANSIDTDVYWLNPVALKEVNKRECLVVCDSDSGIPFSCIMAKLCASLNSEVRYYATPLFSWTAYWPMNVQIAVLRSRVAIRFNIRLIHY
jgi:hypothetical protein